MGDGEVRGALALEQAERRAKVSNTAIISRFENPWLSG